MGVFVDPGPVGRLRRVCRGLIVFLNVCLVSSSGRGASQQVPEPEIEPWLSPGTEVVFKESDTALIAGDWLAPSQDHLSFVIESVQGERLLLASHDKSRRGWVRRAHAASCCWARC